MLCQPQGPRGPPGARAIRRSFPAPDPAGFGEHGSYKIPFFVPRGSTVTVTIDPPARGHVVIHNPYALHGVTAATYRPCSNVTGFFAQGFAFTNGQIPGLRAAGGARRRSGARAARDALSVRGLLRGGMSEETGPFGTKCL